MLVSVDIYFVIENGNALDSIFVFRSAFTLFQWAAEGQPSLVSSFRDMETSHKAFSLYGFFPQTLETALRL